MGDILTFPIRPAPAAPRPMSADLARLVAAAEARLAAAARHFEAASIAAKSGLVPAPPTGRAALPVLPVPASAAAPASCSAFVPVDGVQARLLDRSV